VVTGRRRLLPCAYNTVLVADLVPASDDQESHAVRRLLREARRSGSLRPRAGATLPPAPIADAGLAPRPAGPAVPMQAASARARRAPKSRGRPGLGGCASQTSALPAGPALKSGSVGMDRRGAQGSTLIVTRLATGHAPEQSHPGFTPPTGSSRAEVWRNSRLNFRVGPATPVQLLH
jgi:hypothetical protein